MKNEIAKAIRELAGIAPETFVIGKVSDVTSRTCTVTPVDGGAAIEKVRLNAYTEGDQGMIVKPKDGTYAIVAMLSEVDGMMVMCYEIDAIEKVINETSFKMSDGETLFNGGENGGFVIVANLVNKINAIENDINTLKQVFSAWAVVAQDGGAALKTAAATWASQQITNTVANDIENDKVKH